jgi:hypothetical protein
MKRVIWIATIVLAAAMVLPAQQGRGGAPQAFGDVDKDGICDATGKPVGQARAAQLAAGQQVGQGRGQGCRRGRGRGNGGQMARGRGMGRQGRGMGMQQQQQTPAPAAEAPAESK